MNAMSRILPILLVLIAFLPLGTCSAQSTANEKYDLELERFIRGTNRDVKNLERDVKYILRKIGDLELPRCVVNRWLKNYESSRSSTIQILRDRLDYQEELVTKVKSRLAELFPEQERISDSVSSLAKKIAANEGGISRVEETIIPEIKKYLEQHRGLISDNLALILVVDAKYDLKFSDICTRMRAKEQRLAQQSQELQAQANQISNLNSERHSVRRASYETPSGTYSGQTNERQFVEPQYVEPQYVQPSFNPQQFRSQSTPGCVLYLVQANVEYQMTKRVHWSDGSYSDQTTIYRGNMYQSCSGQLVLLY